MGNETTHAGKAPCRNCGKAATQAPVQRLVASRGFSPPELEGAQVHPGVLRPSSGGAPLPGAVQRKMEAAFGHDFSAVRVHHGGEAKSIGAAAFTRGTHLHFAPGLYQPHSPAGQRLLGHELAHVVQQRAGRVARPAGDVPINADPALEREADAAGARAARSAPAAVETAGPGGSPLGGGPQRGTASVAPAIQPMLRILSSRTGQIASSTMSRGGLGALATTGRPQFTTYLRRTSHPPVPTMTSTSVRGFATVPEVPKKGPMASLAESAQKTGVGLTGVFLSGLVPKNKDHHARMPKEEDYTGKREQQLLSQASELVIHYMKTKHGHKEVEVQHGYGEKDGKARIFASANSAKGQELLRGSTADMADVVKTAVQSKDKHVRRVGNKFMYHAEQQSARRAAAEKIADPAKRKQEMDSIARADVLHAHIMGGGVEPVGGVDGLHAEQGVDAGMRKAGVEPKAIFGSKIRCASCSSRLGFNRTVDGVKQSGRFYPGQVGPGEAEGTLRALAEGKAKVVTNRSKRSRSLSPAARQARIEADSGTSGPPPGSEAGKADEPRGRSRSRRARGLGRGRGSERAASAPLPDRDARDGDERRGRSLTRTPARR
jgi:hypothetical protein